MKVNAKASMPPIVLRVDASKIATAIGEEMLVHWLATTRSGRQPDGTALPRNREGRPLGVGGGSLLRGWRVVMTRQSRGTATVAARPSARARQLTAIRVMMVRGVKFQSLDGLSLRAFRGAIARHARAQLR
jgi:hypothetical protein